MRNAHKHHRRVLAIDPGTRGFGFAVLEDNERLVDWGVAELYSTNVQEFLVRLEALVVRYRPALLAVEDVTKTRRGVRARRLMDEAVAYVTGRNIATMRRTREEVRHALGLSEDATNHAAAIAVAAAFTELAVHLPRKRRLWETERSVMRMFGAVAMALRCLGD